jgi:hypothetical protein
MPCMSDEMECSNTGNECQLSTDRGVAGNEDI